jgi:hypothetical protein
MENYAHYRGGGWIYLQRLISNYYKRPSQVCPCIATLGEEVAGIKRLGEKLDAVAESLSVAEKTMDSDRVAKSEPALQTHQIRRKVKFHLLFVLALKISQSP